jgi:hypothetical protein
LIGTSRHREGRARTGRLRRVVVQVDFVGLSNNFAVGIVATCTTDVVRALQLSAVWTLGRVAGYE